MDPLAWNNQGWKFLFFSPKFRPAAKWKRRAKCRRQKYPKISPKIREILAIFSKNRLQLENFWERSFCFGLFRRFFSDFVKKNLYLYSSKRRCWTEALMAEDGGVRAWRWVDFMAERERVEAMGPASRAMGLVSSGDGLGEQRWWVRRAATMCPASSGDDDGGLEPLWQGGDKSGSTCNFVRGVLHLLLIQRLSVSPRWSDGPDLVWAPTVNFMYI